MNKQRFIETISYIVIFILGAIFSRHIIRVLDAKCDVSESNSEVLVNRAKKQIYLETKEVQDMEEEEATPKFAMGFAYGEKEEDNYEDEDEDEDYDEDDEE